ncbi:MAG: flavodoxin [Lachnospiraceae bacterium]|nr:flavodoxin [Lachnospiraceae bacterium]
MKKWFFIFLVAFMLLSMVACGNRVDVSENQKSESDIEKTASVSQPEQETKDAAESKETPSAAEAADLEETGEESGAENSKVLVAYFSATGTTKKLAEYAADAMGADLYEIMPEEPYTDDDLNYSDRSTRATVEQNDKNVRPAISGSVENMDQYEIVFLAFPIWWGEEPRIMDTFVEAYDFSGKTVIPFCTSGGSGIGSSGRNMQNLSTGDATWLDGARLGGSSSREDMVDWINGLGLEVEAK